MSGTEYAEVEAELAARGYTRMVFDLARIEALLDLLGSPQRAYPAIHITGTNGKTSTARMIDSLLRAHGLRTGRYTSPHLTTVRERISIDADPVDESRFVEIYREVSPAASFLDQQPGAESLTYFDMTTAMALAAFADAPVDVAVVEVGLGGAQDSTNVLQAATCVLTPIGLDHTQWLGETLGEIAAAKAGIVHEAATLVCATQPEAALPAIERRCAEMAATLLMQGLRFGVVRRSLAFGGQLLTLHGLGGEYDDVFLPLHGAHQAQNAAVALAAAECFLGAATPGRRLEPTVVREGFAAATSPGRLEPVRSSPTVLVDAAHNPHGMAATVAALADEFGFTHLVVVLAVLADKDAAGMLALLAPVADELICTQNSSPRAMPAGELAALAGAALPPERIKVCADLAVAVERALQLVAHPAKQRSGVGVLVTGSVVTAGEARTLLAS